ncbi:hypothetical protein [Sulfitobacter geojensis]|uniref:hypothetical protein n=1 Tax=Sulfitobacter geojensis TaxID=1342299 RepID=UPI0036D9D1C5
MASKFLSTAIVLGCIQSLLWGLQHPFQAPIYGTHGGSLTSIAFLNVFGSLFVLFFFSGRLFFLRRTVFLREIISQPNVPLWLGLHAIFSIASLYLYAFGQNRLGDPVLVALVTLVSPFAAIIFATNAHLSLKEILAGFTSGEFARTLVFHLFLTLLVIVFIFLTREMGSGNFDIPGLLSILLVPFLFFASYFLVVRYFYYRPTHLSKQDISIYKTASCVFFISSSAMNLGVSIIIVLLSNYDFLELGAGLNLTNIALYLFGVLATSCLGSLWYFYTYRFKTRGEATFYYHSVPIFSAIIALPISFLADFGYSYTNYLATFVFLTVIVVAIHIFKRKYR